MAVHNQLPSSMAALGSMTKLRRVLSLNITSNFTSRQQRHFRLDQGSASQLLPKAASTADLPTLMPPPRRNTAKRIVPLHSPPRTKHRPIQ
jgi:hypothetical protein